MQVDLQRQENDVEATLVIHIFLNDVFLILILVIPFWNTDFLFTCLSLSLIMTGIETF